MNRSLSLPPSLFILLRTRQNLVCGQNVMKHLLTTASVPPQFARFFLPLRSAASFDVSRPLRLYFSLFFLYIFGHRIGEICRENISFLLTILAFSCLLPRYEYSFFFRDFASYVTLPPFFSLSPILDASLPPTQEFQPQPRDSLFLKQTSQIMNKREKRRVFSVFPFRVAHRLQLPMK